MTLKKNYQIKNMYEKLEEKMFSHFGQEGLIIYSKSNDYYKTNPVIKEDIQMFYQLLISQEKTTRQFYKINYISCCLYYLSKADVKLKDFFLKNIIHQINPKNDEINDEHLFLIYNIIEYESIYLQSTRVQLEFLLRYLERFVNHQKNFENYILYKYYKGLLNLKLSKFEEATKEYLEIVSDLFEEEHSTSNYISFLQLKNSLFYAQIIKNSPFPDLNQINVFLRDLYEQVKKENKFLSIKLGFSLYNNLFKQNKYNDCVTLLLEMKHILKSELFSGETIANCLDFYLAISARLGFLGVLINNDKALKSSVKNIEKSLKIIESDKNNKKMGYFNCAYSLILLIIKNNNKESTSNSKAIAANFKSLFLQDMKKINISNIPYDKDNFIINRHNLNDIIINLNIINNFDFDISTFCKNNILDFCLNQIKQNIPLGSPMIMTFLLSIHDIIYHITNSYCTDTNQKKREDYKKNIILFSEKVFAYLKQEGDKEPLLSTPFLKSVIIEIFSAYTHVLFYEQKLDIIHKAILFFDSLSKKININESVPSYELIYKIKGDFWYYNKFKDLDAAVSYYEKAIEKMNSNNPRKPVIYFNIGYIYYLKGKMKLAFDNIYRCINNFNEVERDNNSNFEFYRRPGGIDQKKLVAQKLLDALSQFNS